MRVPAHINWWINCGRRRWREKLYMHVKLSKSGRWSILWRELGPAVPGFETASTLTFFFLTKISFFLLDVFYVKQYVIADFDSLFQWFSLWHISVSLNTYSDKMQCSAQNIIATHFCIKSPCFRQKGFAAHGVACKNALQHEEVLPLSAYFILHVRAHNDLLPSWIT